MNFKKEELELIKEGILKKELNLIHVLSIYEKNAEKLNEKQIEKKNYIINQLSIIQTLLKKI